MRSFWMLMMALSVSTAYAASPDWQHLANVPMGTTIVVNARETIVCHFEQTLAGTLYCQNSGREFEIPQADIESVRRVRARDEEDVRPPFVGGAAFLGALAGSRAGMGGVVIGAVSGAAAGGLATFALHRRDGRELYHRP